MAVWTTPISHATGDPIVASDFNLYVAGNANYLYGDTGWTTPSFINSWSTPQDAAYRRVGNLAMLRGSVQGGANGSAAFVLPSGYRPTNDRRFAVWDYSAQTVAQVYLALSSGDVIIQYTASLDTVMLDGVIWSLI